MPKIKHYPLDSYQNAEALAEKVYESGGQILKENCAKKMGKPLSGQFQTLIGSAVKYGLIINKKNTIHSTQPFQNIALAYEEEEKQYKRRELLFKTPLFKQLSQTPHLSLFPEERFQKQLVKEFNVESKNSKLVYKVIKESLSFMHLLEEDGTLSHPFCHHSEENSEALENPVLSAHPHHFKLQLTGPDIKTEMKISSLEDLHTADALLQLIRRKLF